MNVSVDVETIVLAGQHYTPVVHQSHIKALGVFHLEKKISQIVLWRISTKFFWDKTLATNAALNKVLAGYLAEVGPNVDFIVHFCTSQNFNIITIYISAIS